MAQGTGNGCRISVPFPFHANNTNYSVAINEITATGMGTYTNSTSVDTKYTDGLWLDITNQSAFTNLGAFHIRYDITITFA